MWFLFTPIQSDTLQNFYIYKTKTDTIDAVVIIQVVHMNLHAQPYLPSENIVHLKQLLFSAIELSVQLLNLKEQ
jgi:hypothetical protein